MSDQSPISELFEKDIDWSGIIGGNSANIRRSGLSEG